MPAGKGGIFGGKNPSKPEEQAQNEDEVQSMKSGDYMIHIFLQAGKSFKMDGNDKFNAMFKFNCFDQDQYSKTKEDCPLNNDNNQKWNEHIFLEVKKKESDELQQGSIHMTLLDKGMFKDRVVGKFEIDLSQIYGQNQEHCIEHQWVALCNPEAEDPETVKGFVKMSLSVQGPGDNKIRLKEDPLSDTSEHDVLMPASLKRQFKQLHISILKATHLPVMDIISLKNHDINAYLITQWKGKTFKTKNFDRKSGSKDRNCYFNQTIKFGIQWPLNYYKLKFQVYDHETIQDDEIVGTLEIDLKNIVQNFQTSKGGFRWYEVYGASTRNIHGDAVQMMNKNPQTASKWHGRILFHFKVEDTKYPEEGVFSVTNEINDQYKEFDQNIITNIYNIKCEFIQAYCLPPDKKKMKYQVKIGSTSLESKVIDNTKHGHHIWKSSTIVEGKYSNNFMKREKLEDIFIYLKDSNDNQVAFWRGSPQEFLNPNPEPKWIRLRQNYPVKACTEKFQASLVQIKLRILKIENDRPIWKTLPVIRKEQKQEIKTHIVRCFIYQCRDLAAIDEDGTSDPYVKVFNPQGKKLQTPVFEDTVNPLIYSIQDFEYDFADIADVPPIVLNVFDHDDEILDMQDDYMGSAIIDLKNQDALNYNSDIGQNLHGDPHEILKKPIIPKWFEIRDGLQENSSKCGEILCSFAIVRKDFVVLEEGSIQLDLASQVKQKEYNIDINILGLRELRSFGLIPVQKAFVKFLIKNMLPQTKAKAVQNLKTDPNKPGPNPNLNTSISFVCTLPKEKLFSPVLSCEVYDQIFKGLKQPKLGTFNIEVGKIQHEQKQNRKQIVKLGEFSIQHLQQAMVYITPKGLKKLKPEFLNSKKESANDPGISQQNEQNDLFNQSASDIQNMQRDSVPIVEREYVDNLHQAHGINNTEDESHNISQSALTTLPNIQSAPRLSVDQRLNQTTAQNHYLQPIQEEEKAPGSGSHNASFQQDVIFENMMNPDDGQVDPDQTIGDIEVGLPLRKSRHKNQLSLDTSEQSVFFNMRDHQRSAYTSRQQNEEVLTTQSDHKEDSIYTFTESTKSIKARIEEYLENSQFQEMDEEVKQVEREDFIEHFKRGMFAKCSKVRTQSQKIFKQMMQKMKVRRQIRFKTYQEDNVKEMNKKMNLLETKFLQHFQEQKKNSKLFEKQINDLRKQKIEEQAIEQNQELLSNIIAPKYDLCKRINVYKEHDPPPEQLFIPLGYDRADPEGKKITNPKKHYRRFFDDELENNKKIFTRNAFLNLPINKIKLHNKSLGNLISSLFGGGNHFEDDLSSAEILQVGYFKGVVQVYDEDEKRKNEVKATTLFYQVEKLIKEAYYRAYEEELEIDISKMASRNERMKLRNMMKQIGILDEKIITFLHEYSYTQLLSSQFQCIKKCVIKLYLIEGYDFASRDIGSHSDPYYSVKCGSTKFDNQDDYQLDEPDPQFHQCLTFSQEFPGAEPLVIDMYDYDDLFGDDLIGTTIVELNDRWFCPDWREIDYKPVEHRELYHPSTSLSQGVVVCWVDIFEDDHQGQLKNKQWDITPQKPEEYQLRVAIYDTKNVPKMDSEGTSDVFIRAWMDEKDKQETDTHWRCQTGQASFNWRMLFNIKCPNKDKSYILKLQVYDRDVLSGNDFICEFELDLYLLIEDVMLTQRPIDFTKKYYNEYFKNEQKKKLGVDPKMEWEDENTVWLQTQREGQKEPIKIRIDIRLLPIEKAKQCKAGEGREIPNHSPELPKPFGRMEFSLNPFKMLSQLVGPDVMKKIRKMICCILFLGIFIMCLPQLASNLIFFLIEKGAKAVGSAVVSAAKTATHVADAVHHANSTKTP